MSTTAHEARVQAHIAHMAAKRKKRVRRHPQSGPMELTRLFRKGATVEGVCDFYGRSREDVEAALREELRRRTWECRYCAKTRTRSAET